MSAGSLARDLSGDYCIHLVHELVHLLFSLSHSLVVLGSNDSIVKLLSSLLNACDKAEADIPQSKERDYLIDFVRNSKRGVIKPYVKRSASAE